MASVADSSTSVKRRRCYSVSYKIRCFYSKGAFLIISWTALVSLSFSYFFCVTSSVLFVGIENIAYSNIALVPAVLFVFCALVAGWFADTRCGNYRVLRVGAILFLFATIVACICSLVLLNLPWYSNMIVSQVISYGLSLLVYIVAFVGVTTYGITTVQLGLDQMPDASSVNITSFISWFVFSIIFGAWLYDASIKILCSCIDDIFLHFLYNPTWISQASNLFPAILMTVVCCSLFLLGPKWLIIEPNCPQSLKTIYQVLKFAWKHKSPLNRSALTYWEEDIPSRMDLGKSRYGGPFTTEQVEDVKSFFRILIMFLPSFFTSCSFCPTFSVLLFDNKDSSCNAHLLYAFTYSPLAVMIIAILLHEFLVYPLIRNRQPSVLKRIEFISFLYFIFNCIRLIFTILNHYNIENYSPWYRLIYSVPLCCLFVHLLATLLEFVCAQSPYKMRGLLLGYAVFLYIVSLAINTSLTISLRHGNNWFNVIVIFTALSLIGFVLYCFLARWYKMRVRDEEYNVHRMVEEVYDKYLSQREQRSRAVK